MRVQRKIGRKSHFSTVLMQYRYASNAQNTDQKYSNQMFAKKNRMHDIEANKQKKYEAHFSR